MPYDKNIIGWMTPEDLAVLEQLSLLVPPNGKVVEIGSLYGRSAACFAMTVDPTVKIHCVDIFHNFNGVTVNDFPDEFCDVNGYPKNGSIYNSFEQFTKNIMSRFQNVEMIRCKSPYFGDRQMPQDIDLVFIDSEHQNPNDWENICYWLPRLKAGGILSGHDYGKHAPAVIENCDRLREQFGVTVNLTSGSSVWYMIFNDKINEIV